MSEDQISIKINICDRFYPLRIKTTEEESVRRSSKLINERAKYWIENFSMQDKQDALSMVALEFASKNQEQADEGEFEVINNKLKDLEAMLDN